MKKIYLLSFLFVVAIFSKLNAQVAVSATLGTATGTYTTLKGAFDAINAGTHKGDIVIDINANTTEGTTPAVLNSSDADPASYTSIIIEPVVDGVSISGNPGAGFGVIELNGADNVFIIGDNPLTGGTNRNLTINNTSAATATYTSVIRLATRPGIISSADNVVIAYCNINGNVTAGNAVGITAASSSSNLSFGVYCGGNAGTTTVLAPAAITNEITNPAANATTINNLVLDGNQINQCGRGIVFNGATTSVSSSLTITGNTIGASGVGVWPFTTPTTTVYAKGIWIAGTDGVYVNGNIIQNILSYVGATTSGIELVSAIGSGSVEISSNTLNGIVNSGSTSNAVGILASSASGNFTIASNTISAVQNIGTTYAAGIQVATAGGIAAVRKNNISGVFARNATGFGAFGVYLSTAAAGCEISNNFVYNIMNVGNASFTNTAENASGILLASGANHKIYNNSVHLSGASTAGGSNMITCLSVASNTITGLDIRNNIFSNTVTGGTGSDAHVCMYFPFAASTSLAYRINNNAYYTGAVAGKSGIAFAGTNVYNAANIYDVANFNALATTPATNFRSYSSACGAGANDYASFGSTAAAPFTSATNLHIPAATVTRLESGGTPLAGITDDYDNGARGSFPDIGADEFVGTLQDNTPPLITYTALGGSCSALPTPARTLVVNIIDVSGVPNAGPGLPVLYWRINAAPYVGVTPSSIVGSNYTFTFGAGATVLGDVISYYIVARDAAAAPNTIAGPSAGSAGFTFDPPAATTVTTPESYLVQSALPSATYTVGVSGAYDFPTLTAAVNAYNTACLTGAVIFNLMDVSYPSETYPVTIGNPQANATNTLTIKPAAGVNATISGSNADAIIKFNGADYVTIDGSNSGGSTQNLTLINTNTGVNSAVIWVASAPPSNGATNNTVKNCAITGSGTLNTFGGIISSGGTATGSVAEAANSNNTYQNNNITTSYYGIIVTGPLTGDNNTVITGNKIGSTTVGEKLGRTGIFMSYQNNVNINNNNILGIAASVGSDARLNPPSGIFVAGPVVGGNIHANIVSDCKNTSALGWSVNGITLASSTANTGLTIYNNFVYDVASVGDGNIPGDNGHGIGILASGGGYNLYYNSINLNTNQTNTNGPIGAGLFIRNGAALLNIRNNIFSNQQSANARYAIFSEAPASAFSVIDYNDYFTLGSNIGFLSSARANIAAWQTATTQDANSISVNPTFISPTAPVNLHLGPASLLNGRGTPIAPITIDIDVETRNITTPDIGADEFTPPNCGTFTGGTASASVISLCGAGSTVLSATGYSFGTGMTYQWQSFNGVTWVPIAGEINPLVAGVAVSATTQYRLFQTCSFGGVDSTSAVTVVVNNPSIISTVPASRCGFGSVTLTANGSAGTQVSWYETATGGDPVATNTASFTTPNISATTTYYAQSFATPVISTVGPVSPSAVPGTIATGTISWDVIFDVTQPVTLYSVDVYPLTAGQTSTLRLYNSAGTVLQSVTYTTTVAGGSTPQTIPVNGAIGWSIPIGSDYFIEADALPSGGLTRNTSGASYPYNANAISIVGNGFSSAYYMYYYNWQYASSCGSSPRTAVAATITAPPALGSVSAAPAAICELQSSSLTASGGGYTNFTWNPGALSGSPVTVTPLSTTTYTVTATGAGSCATTGQVTVTVSPVPSTVTVTPGAPSICAGLTQALTASGGVGTFFSEGFESFPVSKFAVFNSDPSDFIVTENPSTYYSAGSPSGSVRLTHDNDNFLPDDVGAYQTTNDFNLSLYSNPQLSFAHICALERTASTNYDFGYVEYSTDGGATWNTFPATSYTGAGTLLDPAVVKFGLTSYPDWPTQFTSGASTPGAVPATALWKNETIDLSPWQSSTQFRFRFRIEADFSIIFYGWLLDNIRITGAAGINWSPVTDLYTNPGATIPYTLGTNLSTVYTKPTGPRTYTASAIGGSGCNRDTTVVVTYISTPVSVSIAASPGASHCAGDTVTFTATPTNPGSTPTYTWLINGVMPSVTISPASSAGVTVTVPSTAGLYPGMSVVRTAGVGNFAANARIVSILSPTQFTVTGVTVALAGSTIQATGQGQTITTLSYGNFTSGDVVTCVLNAAGGIVCPVNNPDTSAPLTMTVTATTPSSVSIAIDAPNTNSICAGTSITFTATPTYGGAAPTYEWFIGAVSQGAPSLSNTFTTAALANGNVVTCRMVPNSNCPFPKQPLSNSITMNVNAVAPVSVLLAAAPSTSICAGSNVTFTATPTNGGGSPQYEFFVDGVSVQGPGALATWSSTTLNNGEIVTCVLTSSIASGFPTCATGNPDTSNALTMNITTLTVSVTLNPQTAICGNVATLYTAVPTNGGGSPLYEFRVNGGNVQGPSATATYSYTPADGDLIEVLLQSSLGGCASPNPATASFNQTVHDLPTATVTGLNTLCPGIPILLNSNAAAGSGSITSIQWKLGGVDIGGATSATYLANAVGTYTVVVTNSNTCTVTSANFVIGPAATLMSGTYTIGAVTATANAASVGTTINVASTANLVVGALVTVTSGTGLFQANTVITSIIGATSFTVDKTPTTPLAAAATIAGATCTNFISFATAVSALNTRSIGGNCIFDVTPGYTENITAQLALGAPVLNTASNTFTITFQKAGAGANPVINAAYVGNRNPNSPDPDGIWSLNGINNVTIDAINLNDNNSASSLVCMEFGYGLFKAAVVATGGSSSGTTITVASTTGLSVGSGVVVTAGTGVFAPGTTIASITNATTFVVSAAPTTALSAATVTAIDGAQSNTIQNCVIALNRVNVTGGAGPYPAGSTGIVAINAVRSATSTALTGAGAAAANSNNKFYTNIIRNANNGIVLSGFADATPPYAGGDFNNDIGGIASTTGNVIMDFGGGAGAAVQSAGIIANNQWNTTIRYNIINNDSTSGLRHITTLVGILGQAGLSANATISNNYVNIKGGGTTAGVTGIDNRIGANTIATGASSAGTTITVASTAMLSAGRTVSVITAGSGAFAPGTTIVSITNATQFVVSAAPTTVLAGATIFAASNTIDINDNLVTGAYATATTGTFTGIAHGLAAANANTLNMSGNIVRSVSMTGTGTFTGITNGQAAANTPRFSTISNNQVINNAKSAGGTMTNMYLGFPAAPGTTGFIANTITANGNTVSDNSIANALTTATVLDGIRIAGSSVYTITNSTINNLSATGFTVANAITLTGIASLGVGQLQTETVDNNTISNLFVTGASTGIHLIRAIANNTSSTNTRTVSRNTILNLYTNTGSNATITGIQSQAGGNVLITRNYIYDIFPGQNGVAASIARGIYLTATSGTLPLTMTNNVIALDFTRASASTGGLNTGVVLTSNDAVRGIDVAATIGTITNNIYYNSVNLAGGGSGTGFGSAAIFQSVITSTVDLRDNIFNNTMTPGGTSPGFTVAYKRAGAASATYATTSNYNAFYAGTPSASRLLYFDGTGPGSYQTIQALRTGVGSGREAASNDFPTIFTSSINLLPLGANCANDGTGNNTGTGVSVDYTNLARTPIPVTDIGAYEFTSSGSATLVVNQPAAVCTGSTIDLTLPAVTAGSTVGATFRYYTDDMGTILLTAPPPSAVNVSGTYYIRAFTGSCGSATPLPAVTVTVNPNNTWLGVNTTWTDPLNWCPGVPGVATDVTIPTGLTNYPIITAAGPVARNITIVAGASVTINATGVLDVKGNLANSGNLNNSGEITLTGSIAQSFPGATGTIVAMKKLTISNTSGVNPAVTINQNLKIDDAIVPTQGIVNLNNVYVTLRSKVDSTARIGVVGGSFTYTGTGNFVVERYFPGRRAWRLISAPIIKAANKTVFNSWQAGGNNSITGNATYVTGPGANMAVNGLDGSPNNSASLKAFNYLTSGFVGVPATKGASLPSFPAGATGSYLTDTTGYFMFVRGDRTPANISPFNPYIIGNETTLRDTGIVKVGNFTYNCYPGSGGNVYSLVGNPYASAVDFTLLGRTNVNNKFQVWDPTLASVGGWAVWNGGIITPGGTILTNSIIQSKQAFVVESNGAAPSVAFTEASKSAVYNANMFRPAPLPAASLNVNLYFENADGTHQLADGALAKFNEEYSNESDYLDAVKFTNVNETFCIKNGTNYFIQDFRQFPNYSDTIVFNFAKARQFKYKFNISIDNIIRERNRIAYLHDKFLGTALPLNMQGSTEVNFEVNSDVASSAADRFFITFKKVAKFTAVKAEVLYSDANINWSVENAALVNHYEIERSVDGKTFEKAGEANARDNGGVLNSYTITDPNLSPGDYYYRVKAVSNSHGAYDYSDVVKVKILTEKGGLYVYPNPVTDGIIRLKMNEASVEGKYTVRLLSNGGQSVALQQFQHAKATQYHSLVYPAYLASGAYQLEVVSPDKKKSIVNLMISKK